MAGLLQGPRPKGGPQRRRAEPSQARAGPRRAGGTRLGATLLGGHLRKDRLVGLVGVLGEVDIHLAELRHLRDQALV